jgi:hypothetical protein
MYTVVDLRMRVGGVYGEVFQSNVGVKQGDPLSPLLFGLLIDRFEGFMGEHAPLVGVDIAGSRVRVLFYADDLVLLAESAEDLQRALDCLSSFCDATKLAVNTDKSEIVVFNSEYTRAGRQPRWTYQGDTVEVKQKFTYLGVEFKDGSSRDQMKNAHARCIRRGNGALLALMKQCTAIRCFNPHLLCRLFDALVMPVIGYGSEVWGPEALKYELKAPGDLTTGSAEGIHRMFMRMTLRIGKATPIACMMNEMNRTYVATSWVKSICKYWNKLAQGTNQFLKAVLMDNVASVRDGWANGVIDMLLKRGVDILDDHEPCVIDDIEHIVDTWNEECMGKQAWNEADMSLAAATMNHTSGSVVHACPGNLHGGFKSMRYRVWFAPFRTSRSYNDRAFCCMVHKALHVRTIAQFKLGMHWLAVEKGRQEHPCRSNRVCVNCSTGAVEDELHAMVICPVYDHIRPMFPALFESDQFIRLHQSASTGNKDVDARFREYINGQGTDFYSQLGDFLLLSQRLRST